MVTRELIQKVSELTMRRCATAYIRQRLVWLGERVLHSTEVAYWFLTQQPRFDSQGSPKNFIGKIIDVAEVNQRRWLEESGQWL